jgi:hypothetical protein
MKVDTVVNASTPSERHIAITTINQTSSALAAPDSSKKRSREEEAAVAQGDADHELKRARQHEPEAAGDAMDEDKPGTSGPAAASSEQQEPKHSQELTAFVRGLAPGGLHSWSIQCRAVLPMVQADLYRPQACQITVCLLAYAQNS